MQKSISKSESGELPKISSEFLKENQTCKKAKNFDEKDWTENWRNWDKLSCI